MKRLRRLRNTASLRRLVKETDLNPNQLIWPTFVVPGKGIKEPIPSMPGQFHYSIDLLIPEVKALEKKGIGGVLLFGVPDKKDEKASSATASNSLVSQAIQSIKELKPNLVVATDVCLCAYMSHGHCGVVGNNGEILNDPSVALLSAMALAHVKAGADLVAPSDMMDGRVQAIRSTLDHAGFQNTPIMSYSAKFASSFYGPFRDAAHSAPEFGDRKSYQMDPANIEEAIREIETDIEEGADIVMVKPALAYLDVIRVAKDRFSTPIATYQVSGEYSMIKAAAEKGWINEKQVVLETLTAIKRAGANIIISYYAPEVLDWLK